MNNTSDTCMPQTGSGNHTVFIYEGYGGIPETLAINSIAWVLLLFLFAIMRRLAWDYGRIALVSRHEEKQQISPDGRKENQYNVWTSLFYGEHEGNRLHGSMESLDTQLHAQDRGFCSWIVAFVRVKDSDIVKKCGQDALQYITFQRYLLLYLTIVCVLSTAIIIPVNFTGSNIGNATDFGHTTIANLDPESRLLWIHAILSVVYMVAAAIFMRHFSVNLKFFDDEHVSKTLMVAGVPKDKCFKNIMMQHFQEGYADIHVDDVQFAYDVESLLELKKKRATAMESRMNSEIELQKTGHRPTVRPSYPCGQCLCCGDMFGCKEVDAINYYGEEEKRLNVECEREKAKAHQNPLGVAFVTFENVHMAERIHTDFQPSCKESVNPQPSSVHNELDITEWMVTYAPAPKNIYWSKLALSGWRWWLKALFINTAVIVLLFFLTTPTIVLNNLDRFNYKDYFEKTHSSVLIHFLPTLLLWTFTALLPNIVWYSDQYVGHWTRSSEHHAMMRKIFIFLILMVLILPSLGLTSAKALFDFFILDHEKVLRWKCIFLAGNGAFFVNYVITAAFIGTALELLRFSELFTYVLKLLFAKSSAERTSVRKHVLMEFQYGMQYAWVLCVFATIMSYSISCPLITPFGLVYMVLKHVVDRYNLYFAYKASHISPTIHSTAINFVIIAVVFLQFNFVFFTVIRGGYDQALPIFAMIVLLITLMVFFGRVCFGCFKSMFPQSGQNKYKQFGEQNGGFSKMDDEDDNQCYVPDISEDQNTQLKTRLSATESLAHSYGTMENREQGQSQPYGSIQDRRPIPEPAFTDDQ